MQFSETVGEIAVALAAAQSLLKNPPRNKVNNHFGNKYVDLVDGLDAIRNVFSAHQLAFIQGTHVDNGVMILDTIILHSSGEWISSTYPVCSLDKPQTMGSALTYARRYAAFSMAGFSGEDDDDGNAANATTEPLKKAHKAPEMPKQTITPGLLPEDSSKALEMLKHAIKGCTTKAELADFNKENSQTIGRLTPEDKDQLRTIFGEKQKQVTTVSNG